MPAAVSLVLLLVWLGLAYRSYQRGDLLFAGIFLLVGIVITIHRLRSVNLKASHSPTTKP
jgi:hypothetical protein